MKHDTIQALKTMFAKHPIMQAGPIKEDEVLNMERQVGFPLPSEYKEFVVTFGGAVVGPFRVFGLRASPAMGEGEESALVITERCREENFAGTSSWLVVSMDHSGNPIGSLCRGLWNCTRHGPLVFL